jgi:integrase
MLQASRLSPADSLRPKTAVALFGLIASSGLRISEAVKLTKPDVDLDLGILRITQGKFGKSRLVPIHQSTLAALRQYVQHRDRHPRAGNSTAFFLNGFGRPLSCNTAQGTFSVIRKALGWTTKGRRSPRIHDLRHTFAVQCILRWYKENADVDQRIAGLATYLGHAHVSDTYWYLTAVPELFEVTSNRFEHYADRGAR